MPPTSLPSLRGPRVLVASTLGMEWMIPQAKISKKAAKNHQKSSKISKDHQRSTLGMVHIFVLDDVSRSWSS